MGTGELSGKPNRLLWVTLSLTSIPSKGEVVILRVTSCWVSCNGLSSYPGGRSNSPSCLILSKPDYNLTLQSCESLSLKVRLHVTYPSSKSLVAIYTSQWVKRNNAETKRVASNHSPTLSSSDQNFDRKCNAPQLLHILSNGI